MQRERIRASRPNSRFWQGPLLCSTLGESQNQTSRKPASRLAFRPELLDNLGSNSNSTHLTSRTRCLPGECVVGSSMYAPAPDRGSRGVHGDTHIYVCTGGYLHNAENGKVECPLCGRSAYSHKKETLIQWESAHERCCSKRRTRVQSSPAITSNT